MLSRSIFQLGLLSPVRLSVLTGLQVRFGFATKLKVSDEKTFALIMKKLGQQA